MTWGLKPKLRQNQDGEKMCIFLKSLMTSGADSVSQVLDLAVLWQSHFIFTIWKEERLMSLLELKKISWERFFPCQLWTLCFVRKTHLPLPQTLAWSLQKHRLVRNKHQSSFWPSCHLSLLPSPCSQDFLISVPFLRKTRWAFAACWKALRPLPDVSLQEAFIFSPLSKLLHYPHWMSLSVEEDTKGCPLYQHRIL